MGACKHDHIGQTKLRTSHEQAVPSMINGACLEILEACVQAGFSKEDKRAAPKARECARVQGSDLVRHQWAVASAGLGWQEGVCHPSMFSAGTTLQMKAPL